MADKRNIKAMEHERRLVDEKRKRALAGAEAAAKKLGAARVVIRVRAGEEGKLFGSVTNSDIERALGELGFAVERRSIRLDDPIKALGEFKVPVALGVGVQCEVTVTVTALEE